MFGKGAIIMVFGFTVAFSLYQVNLTRGVTRTVENFNTQYVKAIVRESALSGMNLGINKVWAENATNEQFTFVANLCTTDVTITQNGADTIRVIATARSVAYNKDYYFKNNNSMEVRDSIIAVFGQNIPVSRFFWFTNNENNVFWISGDTVRGPMHTNNIFYTSGAPVFYGKVTAKNGITPNPGNPLLNNAEYLGGWEIGVDSEVPTDFSQLQTAAQMSAGGHPVNTMSYYNQPVEFEFLFNGDVVRTVNGGAADTVTLADIATTGVIHGTEDIRVKGILDGQLTIFSGKNIWIDDDLVYADNPAVNPNSDDLMGLVAYENIWVTDNTANRSDCTIQAAMLAGNHSFRAENYNTRPLSGTLNVYGGIIQDIRGPVGTFETVINILITGFQKNYEFDQRLLTMSPPSYPYLRRMNLLSWWE